MDQSPIHVRRLLEEALTGQESGDWPRAEAVLRQALEQSPSSLGVRTRLGRALKEQKRWVEAEQCFREVLAAAPDHLATLYDLAMVLAARDRPVEARATLERLTVLSPRTVEVWHSLAVVQERQDDLAKAVDSLRTAAKLSPKDAAVHEKLGDLLHDTRQNEQAEAHYRLAMEVAGSRSELLNKLGIVLQEQGKMSQARSCFEQALRASPAGLVARVNLGSLAAMERRSGEALRCFCDATIVQAESPAAIDNLLLCLNYPAADPGDIAELHRQYGAALEEGIPKAPGLDLDLSPGRPLRVGYVSPCFCDHVAALFLEPLLANHDRKQVQIFCYCENRRADATTRRFQALAGGWRPTWGQDGETVARLVQEDRIDILVDLAGRMPGNRLDVFARKPAPIQMTWLGYPNTTGLGRIDYRVTDAWADPPGMTERFHTERLLRLPGGFLSFAPPACATEVLPPPALKNGYVTFGCFNSNAKITDEVLGLWAEVLAAVPDSRLLLKSLPLTDEAVAERTLECLVAHGAQPDRVELRGWVPGYANHLAAYADVDIALDTSPYNGTTTTCEALWMGVPVVALAGQVHAARVGVSLLTMAGLADLVAQTPGEYVRKAAGLAGDLERLGLLRSNMRAELRASRLLDGAAFARSMESLYRQVWQEYCGRAVGGAAESGGDR